MTLKKIIHALAAVKEQATLLVEKYKGSSDVSWNDYSNILQKCAELLNLIKSKQLPLVKPCWTEFTDAGPGVGVNILEVSFRVAELARVYSSDYRIRIHIAAGDRGQNKAERTNSVIGDAVVYGATINWQHHKCFEGITDQQISSLSLQEYNKMEEGRMRTNAWKIAHEVSARIDDAPVLCEYIESCLRQTRGRVVFQPSIIKGVFRRVLSRRKKYRVQRILAKSVISVTNVSLHLEFRWIGKDREWISPAMGRIPRARNIQIAEFHYKDVFDSYGNGGDEPRPPDDWQPKHIKTAFENGASNSEKKRYHWFSTRFVEKDLVEDSKTSFEKNCFSAWASTLNMGLINKVDMVCLSPVGYGV